MINELVKMIIMIIHYKRLSTTTTLMINAYDNTYNLDLLKVTIY